MGFTRQTCHAQSVGNARPQVPPVKSIHKLLEIELPAGATAPVKGPGNIGFGVANDDIDPMKHHLCLRICAERHLVFRMMLLGYTRIYCARIPFDGLTPRLWAFQHDSFLPKTKTLTRAQYIPGRRSSATPRSFPPFVPVPISRSGLGDPAPPLKTHTAEGLGP